MALPSGIATCEVRVGPFTDFEGNLVEGSISFKPSRSLIWVATGVPIMASDLRKDLTSGSAVINLPYTDQDGFSDGAGHTVTNWTYKVTFALKGVESPSAYNFQLPIGPASVDLDLITPVASSTGALVSYPGVISVNGQTGVVTVSGGGGGGNLAGISDMSAIARIVNAQSTAEAMRDELGAGTASTKSDVGLGNVANTAPADLPVSNAVAAKLARVAAVILQDGGAYPTPLPTGFAAYHFYGTLDPVSQGFTLEPGDLWFTPTA